MEGGWGTVCMRVIKADCIALQSMLDGDDVGCGMGFGYSCCKRPRFLEKATATSRMDYFGEKKMPGINGRDPFLIRRIWWVQVTITRNFICCHLLTGASGLSCTIGQKSGFGKFVWHFDRP